MSKDSNFTHQDCSVSLSGNLLKISTARIKRSWYVQAHRLIPLELIDITNDTTHTLNDIPGSTGACELSAEFSLISQYNGAPQALQVKVTGSDDAGSTEFTFTVIPRQAFIMQGITHSAGILAGCTKAKTADSGVALGVELAEQNTGEEQENEADKYCLCEEWSLRLNNHILHSFELKDATDKADNLLYWNESRVSPPQQHRLKGCVFALENPISKAGFIILKHAALPHARPIKEGTDLTVTHNGLSLHDFSCGEFEQSYNWTVIPFTGGRHGITRALQEQRMALHPYAPGTDGQLISNTWGDRSRDDCINQDFMINELNIAREMGIDICQMDDGWQKGVTANSVNAQAAGGVWEGFHAADAQFWTANPERLPNGIEPIIEHAKQTGVAIGLWYAPDSANEFANWQKDVDTITGLYKKYGVRHFKADSVKATSKVGEQNLQKLFDGVASNSNGEILIDLDVTCGVRPGYFGAPQVGAIFVENRYSDWGNYWPHATFRNFWQLCHILPPSILRMEILNLWRNGNMYEGDALAPACYSGDYVFATIMLSSPLMWGELRNINDKQKEEMMRIIPVWKEHRNALHTGITYPIGEAPSGGSWSGFVVEGDSEMHLIVMRERNSRSTQRFELPVTIEPNTQVNTLAGNSGNLEITADKSALVTLDSELSFGWWSISK